MFIFCELNQVRIYGEDGDISDEYHTKTTEKCIGEKLHLLILTHNIDPACLYQYFQTGLFYAKLPNITYTTEAGVNNASGCKRIKCKEKF